MSNFSYLIWLWIHRFCCTVLLSVLFRLLFWFCLYVHGMMFDVHGAVHRYYFYSKTNLMHQCLKFILFWNDTLHVSNGLPFHHQEFKTVHTATGICQTDTVVCFLALSVRQMPVAVCTVLNSWWWNGRSFETCRVSFQNKINLILWCTLLVLL